ncbi:unnamed protein product [Ascophyllum nodosum]
MTSTDQDSQTLTELLLSYETIVLDVKDEVLNAYQQRCAVTESECANLHLDACRSRFPSGECTQDEILDICHDEGCGMIRDFINPSVRLPASVATGPNLNPTDENAIETMCYSVLLNAPLRDLYDRASEVGSNAVYFGAWTGVFRYFPGIAQSACGEYDPRIRPWYVAASSGPKDVVIVLDISGSMSQYGRLDLAKDAAVTVIHTLGADSFINVVAFSEDARVLMPNTSTLVRATVENVDALVDLVQNLEFDLANVATNFGSAFDTTFDLIEASRVTEGASSSCQTAIVFLTDGKATLGDSTEEVIAKIETRNEDIGAQVFSFSLGTLADKLTAKQIACDTGGIYEHVEDGGDLSQAMAFFYRFYAIGLGDNEDFVAVTDIYAFTTNGDLGFTIASPVYDKNSTGQPVFLGVVAMDFKVETFVEKGYTVDQVGQALQRQNEGCPDLSLTDCQRQVFRGSISSLSVCDNGDLDCSGVGSLEPGRCMEESEYPTDLWQNVDFAGLSYTERTCCGSNYTSSAMEPSCAVESAVSGSGGGTSQAISIGVGLAVGVLFAGTILVGLIFLRKRKKNREVPSKRSRDYAVAEAVGPPENAPRDLEIETHQ